MHTTGDMVKGLFAGFALGILVGVYFGMCLVIDALVAEEETCKREHSVYKCVRTYVPAKNNQ